MFPSIDEKRLDEIEDMVKRAHEAMVRIGKESRMHTAQLEILEKKRYEDDVKTGVLQDAFAELTSELKEHSKLLKVQADSFNDHLVRYSKNESNLTRQAIHLYLWMFTGIVGWLLLLFGDQIKGVFFNG